MTTRKPPEQSPAYTLSSMYKMPIEYGGDVDHKLLRNCRPRTYSHVIHPLIRKALKCPPLGGRLYFGTRVRGQGVPGAATYGDIKKWYDTANGIFYELRGEAKHKGITFALADMADYANLSTTTDLSRATIAAPFYLLDRCVPIGDFMTMTIKVGQGVHQALAAKTFTMTRPLPTGDYARFVDLPKAAHFEAHYLLSAELGNYVDNQVLDLSLRGWVDLFAKDLEEEDERRKREGKQ